ncbi:MAG: hypothetical protein H6673_13430 [Anaerolineales bacterium]|nr:hypothetical protein [Anaerolineales bacterium]
MKDRVLSYLVGMGAFALSLWIGLHDYARLEDFYFYRLVLNLAQGHGIIYNPDEAILPTTGPLLVIPTSLILRIIAQLDRFSPAFIPYITLALLAIGYGLAAALLYYGLRRHQFTHLEGAFVITAWLFSWPTWASWNAPTPYTLIFILLGLLYWEHDRPRIGGLLAGMALLVQPEGALGAIALGSYTLTKGWRYWHTVWIPIALWGLWTAFSYPDGIMLQQPLTTGDMLPNLLWIGLGAGMVWLMRGADVPDWGWIWPLWTALEIGSRIFITQQLVLVQSLPLVLTVCIGVVWVSRRLSNPLGQWGSRGVALALIAAFTILNPLQTEANLAEDIRLSQTLYIPRSHSLLHDRSVGIVAEMIDFDGALYSLDGAYSPLVSDYVEREDYTSLIIALAPDYIYFNSVEGPLAGYSLRDSQFKALRYRKELDVELDPGQREGDQLWIRYGAISDFGPTRTAEFAFSPDMRLVSYALTDLHQGDVLRIRLDWELKALPEAPITITLTQSAESIVVEYPVSNWEPLKISTTHALSLPTDETSIAVTVGYRGGEFGPYHIRD